MTIVPITVGVDPSDGSAGWVRVLRREGIPFEVTEEPRHPIHVCAGPLPSWTERFLAAGGVTVLSGATADQGLLGPAESAVTQRFMVPDGRDWATAPGLVRLFRGGGWGEVRLHENRKVKGGNDPDRFPVVLSRRIGSGTVVWTGIPLTDLLTAAGDCLRRFSPLTDVTERVASVDKAEVAETLVWMLRLGFEAAGIPYVRLAMFPEEARSVLVLRIDVDGVFDTHVARLVAAAESCGLRLSFFINGELADERPGELPNALAPHEVGHHGYAHNVFDDVDANVDNLTRGAEWVRRKLGREPEGFVAPRGLWNAALEEALVSLGYTRSGDFALEFDSHPFRTPKGILQIPVHPYSPERATVHAEEAGQPPPTSEEVSRHYVSVLRRQLARGRPCHLYGHPEVLGAMAEDVLPAIAGTARREGLPNLTVGEYERWWCRREEARMSLWMDEGSREVEVRFDGPPLPVEVSGTRADLVRVGRHARPMSARALDAGTPRPGSHTDPEGSA